MLPVQAAVAHHAVSHSHSRHPQEVSAEQDCKFDTKVIFTDLFGSSAKSPWQVPWLMSELSAFVLLL